MHHHMLAGSSNQHQILETGVWLSLLRACSGFEAFMRRHQGRVSQAGVVSFLLFEPAFPRSLRYCIHSALGMLRRVWPERTRAVEATTVERLEALERALLDHERQGLSTSIHELLTHVVDEASAMCVAVQQGMAGDEPAQTQSQTQSQTQTAALDDAAPGAANPGRPGPVGWVAWRCSSAAEIMLPSEGRSAPL